MSKEFYRVVTDGTDLISLDSYGRSEKIGVVLSEYDALLQQHDKYRDALIKHGLIEVPPTIEQVSAKLDMLISKLAPLLEDSK